MKDDILLTKKLTINFLLGDIQKYDMLKGKR